MKNYFLLIMFFWSLMSCSQYVEIKPQELNKNLILDPELKIGTLPNGLKYYLRKNNKPANEAVFRLVVKIGSLQEKDQERGVAHFVEHMAFIGSTHFSKNEVVDLHICLNG